MARATGRNSRLPSRLYFCPKGIYTIRLNLIHRGTDLNGVTYLYPKP